MIKQLKFLVLSFLLFSATMNAQVTTSGISGKVTSNGEPVIGASVIATHTPSGTTYSSITNVDGRYNITGMRVGGPYTVKFSYIGYQSVSISGINLALGETENVSTTLKESATNLQEAIVEAKRAPAKNGTITNISNSQLTKLPTISRGITDFTKLSPFAGGSSSFAGRDGRYNTITLDGASLNNSFGLSTKNLPGGDAQPVSLDAIEEISVNVSPYDVKYSSFTGASINVITKGGTNKFHGSAYTFIRPESFTGSKVDTFKVANANTKSSKTYGFTLGGPIIKNKLFFFVNGEIEKQTYPGVEWKPSTNGTGDTNTKTSRTTEADLLSMSNFLKSTYNYDPGKYKDFDKFESSNWKVMARLDWNISQKHKFMLRLNAVESKNDQQVSSNSAPNPRGANRISIESMAFSNSNYKLKNVVSSLTGELNSTFTSNISNKLLATYTHIQDTRSQLGDPFPFVDIYKDGKQYMSFGTELFTPNNNVVNNVLSFIDNVSITLNKHYVTMGASFEKQYFMNSYLRYPYGYYRYASMNDFTSNAAPTAYGLTYGYNGNDAPGAELNFGMGGLYAQDEWYVNDGLRLTYGLRLDMPMYLDNMTGNSAINALTFADGRKIDVSQWPATKVLLSPRVGFRWDVKNDRSIVVNGGTGIFTGVLPFVWFTNQPTNAGTLQNTVELTGTGIPATLKFNQDYKAAMAANPALFPSTPTNTVPGSIAFVDPDFKMPQVWRSSLGADVALPYGFDLSVNGLFTRDIYNVTQINVNEKAPTLNFVGNDNRSYYSYLPSPPAKASTPDNKINSAVSSAMMLTNGKEKGYQYSFNATLTKRLIAGFSGFVSYTFTEAKDMTSNPGSSASSAWSSNTAVNSLNDPGLSYSNFATPHRIISSLSYELELFNLSKTTFSIFYSGYNTGRVSYTYSNDLNRDNNSSDLIYIPNSKDELVFADIKSGATVTYSKADQANDFWNYVEGNDYLKNRKGKYVERFGDLKPWLNRFDFKITQDFHMMVGENKCGLQLSLDILNVGNMINSKWGAYKTNGIINYDNVSPLKVSSIGTDKVPVYQINATNSTAFKANSAWKYDVSTGSTWGMMLGAKISF